MLLNRENSRLTAFLYCLTRCIQHAHKNKNTTRTIDAVRNNGDAAGSAPRRLPDLLFSAWHLCALAETLKIDSAILLSIGIFKP